MTKRTITIHNIIFSYKIGKKNIVITWRDKKGENCKRAIPFDVLLNKDWKEINLLLEGEVYNIDEGVYKRLFHIYPRDIATYLHRHYFRDEQVPLTREHKFKKMLNIV